MAVLRLRGPRHCRRQPLLAHRPCRLHGIDPETYFAELLHVLPYWPRDRYLELAPKYWNATRATLAVAEIDREIGPITVPQTPPRA